MNIQQRNFTSGFSSVLILAVIALVAAGSYFYVKVNNPASQYEARTKDLTTYVTSLWNGLPAGNSNSSDCAQVFATKRQAISKLPNGDTLSYGSDYLYSNLKHLCLGVQNIDPAIPAGGTYPGNTQKIVDLTNDSVIVECTIDESGAVTGTAPITVNGVQTTTSVYSQGTISCNDATKSWKSDTTRPLPYPIDNTSSGGPTTWSILKSLGTTGKPS